LINEGNPEKANALLSPNEIKGDGEGYADVRGARNESTIEKINKYETTT
jgi:hypothetical protein